MVCLVIHTIFARDGGAIRVDNTIYNTRELAVQSLEPILNNTDAKAYYNKNNQLKSIELNDPDYPWTAKETWYLEDKDIIRP